MKIKSDRRVNEVDLQITLEIQRNKRIRGTLTNTSFCFLLSISCIFDNAPVITLILDITEYSAYTQNDSLQIM